MDMYYLILNLPAPIPALELVGLPEEQHKETSLHTAVALLACTAVPSHICAHPTPTTARMGHDMST